MAINNNGGIDMNLLMGLLNGNANKEQFVQNLVARNPQMNAIMQQVQNSGMSVKDFTIQYAKQNNINLDPFMNMLPKQGK